VPEEFSFWFAKEKDFDPQALEFEPKKYETKESP